MSIWARVAESALLAVIPDPNGAADLRLLQRVASRDTAALAELYDRHCRLAYGIILRILRSPSDAEEVLQEVFVNVWTKAETYDERLGSPAAWLLRIARNRAIDRFRAKRARGDDAPSVDEVGEPAHPVTLDTPERLAQDAATATQLRTALQTLPDGQRQLIEAAFYEGYTHQELADRFSLPLGTVKTRIRTGLTAMRVRLEHAV